jgi:hypothetical protein
MPALPAARHRAPALRRTATAVAAVCCLAALGACGGSGEPARQAGGLAGSQDLDLNTLACEDWRRSSPSTRRAIIEKIRGFAGGTITGEGVGKGARGAVLDDDHAYRLFEGRCREELARGFLLYKLYTHAAAFAGKAN